MLSTYSCSQRSWLPPDCGDPVFSCYYTQFFVFKDLRLSRFPLEHLRPLPLGSPVSSNTSRVTILWHLPPGTTCLIFLLGHSLSFCPATFLHTNIDHITFCLMELFTLLSTPVTKTKWGLTFATKDHTYLFTRYSTYSTFQPTPPDSSWVPCLYWHSL